MPERMNLNDATVNDLVKINMISEERAQAIVDYRNLRGPFKDIQDLKHVPGFSNKLMEIVDLYFSVDPPQEEEERGQRPKKGQKDDKEEEREPRPSKQKEEREAHVREDQEEDDEEEEREPRPSKQKESRHRK